METLTNVNKLRKVETLTTQTSKMNLDRKCLIGHILKRVLLVLKVRRLHTCFARNRKDITSIISIKKKKKRYNACMHYVED